MSKKTYQQALVSGSNIESFEIIDVLGVGGFGITYKAVDNDLHHEVAIKEYLPSDFGWRLEGQTVVPKSSDVTEEYEYGLERFLDEGRTLAKFKHPNIVRVVRFLRANGTGYLVMDYEYGQTFHEYLTSNPQPDEDTLLMVMVSVLKGLSLIHKSGFLHRDIKPGNIYMRKEGEALLIDFGSARFSVGEHSHSMTGIVTAGYAPYEQYSLRAKQGPACDMYALGASIYRALSGVPPVEAPDRITCLQESEQDPLKSALQLGLQGYSDHFLQTIDWMLQPFPKDRPQSAEEVLHHLFPDSPSEDEQETVSVITAPNELNVASPNTESEKITSGNSATILQKKKNASSAAIKNSAGLQYSLFTRPITLVGLLLIVILVAIVLVNILGTDEEELEPPAKMQLLSSSNKPLGNKTRSKMGAHTSSFGNITIVTKPSGAKIHINGKYVGTTPYTNKTISVGLHTVELTKEDFTKYKTKINVVEKNSSSLNLILKSIIKLPFTVMTNVKVASISFINKDLNYRAGMKLSAGYYDLSISAPGYKTRRMRFPLFQRKKSVRTFSNHFKVMLYNENFIKKYNLHKYGRITALKYISRLKYLLVSTIYGELYIIDINPKLMVNVKAKIIPNVESNSKSYTAYDLEHTNQKPEAFKVIAKFNTYRGKVFSTSNDGARIYVGTREGQVLLFDMVKQKVISVYGEKSSLLVRAITVSQDEKRMAVVVGTQLQIWDVKRNKQTLSGLLGKKVSQIFLSKDKTSLLVYRWYQPYFDRISLADNSFKSLQRFSGNDKGLNNMVMSKDHKMIFAEGKNYSIKAWNLKTTDIIRNYKGHSDSVNYIALSAGKLYSAGRDQTLRVWDVNTTKQIAVLQGHRTILGAVAVAPDGTIFSGDDNGQIFLWKLKE